MWHLKLNYHWPCIVINRLQWLSATDGCPQLVPHLWNACESHHCCARRKPYNKEEVSRWVLDPESLLWITALQLAQRELLLTQNMTGIFYNNDEDNSKSFDYTGDSLHPFDLTERRAGWESGCETSPWHELSRWPGLPQPTWPAGAVSSSFPPLCVLFSKRCSLCSQKPFLNPLSGYASPSDGPKGS